MQQSLLDAIIRFAQACDAVTALLLIGSQARTEMKADAFSDTDLIMIVQNPDDFIHSGFVAKTNRQVSHLLYRIHCRRTNGAEGSV